MDTLTIYIDDRWQALDTDGAPAITYQINTLTDLKDRNALYSQSIDIPLTTHNRRVLGCIDLENVGSTVPYRNYPCRYYVDGINIIGADCVFSINSIEGSIKGQIRSAIKDFFGVLQNKPIADMNLGYIRWTCGDIELGGNPSNALPYRYMFARVEKGQPGLREFLVTPTGEIPKPDVFSLVRNLMPQMHFLPFYRFLDLVEVVLSDNGYTLDTDLKGLPGYADDYLPIGLTPTFGDTNSFDNNMGEAFGTFPMPSSAATGWPVYTALSVITKPAYACLVPDDTYSDAYGNKIQTVRYEVLSGHKARVTITLIVNPTDPNTYPYWIRVMKLNLAEQGHSGQLSDISTEAEWENPDDDPGIAASDGRMSFEADLEFDANDIIFFYVCLDVPTSYNPVTGRGATATVTIDQGTIEDNNHVIPGSYIYPNINTGFVTQYDVIKAFIQTYALNAEIDRAGKKFRAYSFKKLYDSQRDAVDWTGKAGTRGNVRTLSFADSTYGQKNLIAFKEDTEEKIADSGVFLVDNTNLDESKQVLELPYEAGKDVRSLLWAGPPYSTTVNVPVVNIPIYDITIEHRIIKVDGLPPIANAYAYAGNRLHIVRPGAVIINSAFIQMSPLQADWSTILNIPIARHVGAQSLVDTYYQYLSGSILRNYKAIEEELLLTPLDIIQFDYLTPVWIGKYNAYFYVQKITNFQTGKLTKCNLIKM
jgi:hypothetical protein